MSRAVMHGVDASIERFRAGFKALGIAETDIKVTWDSEQGWARLRMRLASGAIVEKLDRCQDGEAVEFPLWRLTQHLHRGVKAVRGGASQDAAFADCIVTPAVLP